MNEKVLDEVTSVLTALTRLGGPPHLHNTQKIRTMGDLLTITTATLVEVFGLTNEQQQEIIRRLQPVHDQAIRDVRGAGTSRSVN